MHWITRTAATAAASLALALPAVGLAQAAPAPDTPVLRSNTHSSALAAQDCPSGWLCLYEHSDFNGRMLKFRDNQWQQLSSFGFNDTASSWKNHLGRSACLSWDWSPGDRRLSLPAGGSSTHMGSWSDEASGVKPGSC